MIHIVCVDTTTGEFPPGLTREWRVSSPPDIPDCIAGYDPETHTVRYWRVENRVWTFPCNTCHADTEPSCVLIVEEITYIGAIPHIASTVLDDLLCDGGDEDIDGPIAWG